MHCTRSLLTPSLRSNVKYEERESIYGQTEYYWGAEPNEMAKRTIALASGETVEPTVIDVGAGEGRDAVYFAEQGWRVHAVDISPNGLQKTERLAENRGVEVHTIEADVNTFVVPEVVDVVYSAGTLQYLRPENRRRQFEQFKQMTVSGGIHVLFAFTDHPDVPTPPDWTDNEFFYASGELTGYYNDWECIETRTLRFDDDSGDEPHEHAAEILIAKNPN